MEVSNDMIDKADPELAFWYLADLTYTFNCNTLMQKCAEKAKIELLSFQEANGQPPHHRYDLLDHESLQMSGDIARVDPDRIESERIKNSKIDVNKGKLAKMSKEIKTKTKLADSIEENVSPSHYKEVVPGYQYIQMMEHMLEGKDGVEAHLLGQVYKYLMRSGKKDDVSQEYSKAGWYLNCLIKYRRTGKVEVENIPNSN